MPLSLFDDETLHAIEGFCLWAHCWTGGRSELTSSSFYGLAFPERVCEILPTGRSVTIPLFGRDLVSPPHPLKQKIFGTDAGPKPGGAEAVLSAFLHAKFHALGRTNTY